MSEGAMRLLLYKAALCLQEQPARMVPYSSISWLMETFTTNPVRLRRNKGGSVVHLANEAMLHSTPMGKGVPGFFPVTVICDFTREDLRGRGIFHTPASASVHDSETAGIPGSVQSKERKK